jgi:hypothetical protein
MSASRGYWNGDGTGHQNQKDHIGPYFVAVGGGFGHNPLSDREDTIMDGDTANRPIGATIPSGNADTVD